MGKKEKIATMWTTRALRQNFLLPACCISTKKYLAFLRSWEEPEIVGRSGVGVGDVHFLNDAMFFTMQCFPILNDAIFRRFFKKNIDLDVFDDVSEKLKHRAHDAY